MRKSVALMGIFAILLFGLTVNAQEVITLRLLVQDFALSDPSVDQIFDRFEQENSGLRLEVVSDQGRSIAPPESAAAIPTYLSDFESQVTQADVIYVNSNSLNVEATQAGYVLNLAPLTAQDAALNVADFYPPAWESFQWDGGVWALPVSYSSIALLYNTVDFDAAGLTYPDESWTLTELENAARALSAANDGAPGLSFPLTTALGRVVRSLLGEGVYDETVIPSVPDYSRPELVDLIERLAQMKQDGVLITPSPFEAPPETPLFINNAFFATFNDAYQIAPLPGGTSSLIVGGFAVSRGTLHPEAAYRLARFLTAYPVLTDAGTPARASIVGTEQDRSTFMIDAFPEVFDQINSLAYSSSELRFSSYLNPILSRVQGGASAAELLSSAQAEITTQLNTLYAARDTVEIHVATPSPQVELPVGEVPLSFGIVSNLSPFPTQGRWTDLANEFADADPQIGEVTLDVSFGSGLEDMTSRFDCFYLPSNVVPSADLELLLSVDPLLQADPNFNADDFVGEVLSQVSREGRTWAVPLTILPEVMWYRTTAFEQAGLPAPEGGWTITDFTAALQVFTNDEAPVVTNYGYTDTGVLLLIAAYGGLPLDFRTDPPTVNFDDPATIDAIRQVLDLAKNGQMRYDALLIFSSGSGVTEIILSPLDDSNSRFGTLVTMGGGGGEEFRITTYPQGSQYTGIAYDVGGAYISANTQNPEGCYRFISFIAAHPDLFTSMPPYVSQINSPEVLASRGTEAVAFFNTFVDLLAQPETIEFLGGFNNGLSPLPYWLDRAFDRYVLENADLEAELLIAQGFADDYLACLAELDAPLETTSFDPRNRECAQTADATVFDY
ncbi:MAG: extracellular solute-binding protein [Chitinophagaceae bacterium]|nr:extracellular solute-binding protein [Anaerolineae bacterium]